MALVRAAGHRAARKILVAVNSGQLDQAIELVDREHYRLLKDREILRTVDGILAGIENPARSTVSLAAPLSIGALENGHRAYAEADRQDAELAYLLRRGGHSIETTAFLITQLRSAGNVKALQEATATWQTRVNRRARNLLAAAAAFSTYLAFDDKAGILGAG